jgi:hypothetical protein
MALADKIRIFEKLGIFLNQFTDGEFGPATAGPWLTDLNDRFSGQLESVILNSHIHNPWFTEDNVRYALGSISKLLDREKITGWLQNYNIPDNPANTKTVAIIMAGNIPLVGFHDMLCVHLSGHRLLAKLSVKDEYLPAILAEIISFLSGNEMDTRFEKDRLKGFDAVIATGSNNTSRYFEYYFGKYPSIIRKNRNSAAILDGSESPGELGCLSDDVFRYFGLGCRNVSKIFIPSGYDFSSLAGAFDRYRHIADHNQWANNYEYQRAVHLIDRVPHLDTGFLLMRENRSPASPISVINYEMVDSSGEAYEICRMMGDKLQCIVGKSQTAGNLIPFGKSQQPGPGDYADDIDTMDFLLNL